ncbi:DNA-directed RNA polymerase subunit omega [Limnochorda pilosa]|uniref:DNA-directed RNA polymerase subunit omega n=1 Tax=Limnochorda pilosa TaxID=1555112 RepID=A0A0K2SKP7_LIMPI|nr:DNA-directed RNA polymerase subunit omega [Limnochorda pilosa]BAS27434.1 DNA-directed RNA polymerase subunit omega [Limnochorda pilosa]
MLGQPNLEEIKDKLPSRYALVVAAARRARQVLDGDPPRAGVFDGKIRPKPVTVALHEIAGDKLEISPEGSSPLS